MISFFLLFFPLQCNSTATRGVSKKARVQTPSSQTPLKVAQLLSLLVCLFVNLWAWRDVMSFLIVHFHQHCYSLAELKFIIIKILNNVHNSYTDLWYLYISIANLPGEEGEARRQNYSPSPTGFPIWKGKL